MLLYKLVTGEIVRVVSWKDILYIVSHNQATGVTSYPELVWYLTSCCWMLKIRCAQRCMSFWLSIWLVFTYIWYILINRFEICLQYLICEMSTVSLHSSHVNYWHVLIYDLACMDVPKALVLVLKVPHKNKSYSSRCILFCGTWFQPILSISISVMSLALSQFT